MSETHLAVTCPLHQAVRWQPGSLNEVARRPVPGYARADAGGGTPENPLSHAVS